MHRGDDASFVAPRDPLIGRELGEYVVRERIGAGGFGAVYRAHQAALGREAVIKVLHLRKRADETVVRRFTAEAQVASRLDHPYAAHIYGFGAEDDGLLWIAMELVRGSPLDVTLAVQGPIKLDKFVPFFERVCEVVHTAHEQAIVHRDLKPANIMVLSRAGRLLPKLLDFGIAKVLTSTLLPPSAVGIAQTLQPIAEPSSGLDKTAPLLQSTPQDVALPVGSDTGNEIIGSPQYMAPEQWNAPGMIDARTDLYALGAVAYEALTGKPAFEGKSIAALVAAHAGPIPRLPAGFPSALDAVLAKVLAKEQSDRYSTAIELAEAFRAAAGLRSEKASVPPLDRKVRNRFAERAPEPLADAIAAYESTDNLHAARDSLWHIARSTARWLGVLALSCRSRVGAGRDNQTAVERHLGALRREGLRDLDWSDLARELVRPFEAKRDVYPIPELVTAFFPREGESDAGAQLEQFLRRQASSDPSDNQLRVRLSTDVAAEHLRSVLPDLIRQLCNTLGALWFLTDYEIVVPRGGRSERFNGTRRVPRASAPSDGLDEHAGKPLVLDGEGVPVLVLWPLVQASSPGVGTDDELFLFDGPGRSGARLVAPRQAFEIHDASVWDWFHRTVFAADDVADATIDERPYRGLSAFTTEHAHLFYGREREIDTFVNRLRVTPLLAVVGPSGAGKSSFVQAGALAALGWRSLITRPGASPFAALAARLGCTASELSERPERLGELLRQGEGNAVLVVDQLEELFTLCSDPDEREQFARSLAAAARIADDPVRIIVTLRDDFLMRAESLPVLRERLAAGLHLLGTPKRDDLLRILVEPARRAGFDYEDAALAEEMVTAVANQPGALALLSFTASQLWELRDRHFRHLTRKAYNVIGGVGGALARHAEETLAAMPADQRALVREAFRRLVTADGTRAVLTRRELAQVLGGDSKSESVIEALVSARLIAVSEADDGERLEVTHEALLSAWPRLVEWRREDAAGARMRDQVRSAARQWDERGRPDGLLWRGDALAEFQIWRGRTPGSLTGLEDAFTGTAQRQARRGRTIRRALLAFAFVFMAAALGVVLWLNARAKSERAFAIDKTASLYREQGRGALLSGNPSKALVYLEQAFRLGARDPAMGVLIAAAARSIESTRATLAGHTGKLWSIAYSHDGRRIATGGADGTARIWNARTGALEIVLHGHARDVSGVGFSHDDSVVATGSWDGTAKLWDAKTGALRSTLALGGTVKRVVFDPGGTRLATADGNQSAGTGHARIWDVKTGSELVALALDKYVLDISWSHDGARVVTASSDHRARVWDVATGAEIALLAGHTDLITEARFSPDDQVIATASRDTTAALWDSRDGKRLASLVGHTALVSHVEFSPDGRVVVTSSLDKTARSWDGTTGRLLVSFEGHQGQVNLAAVSPDRSRLLTASGDGTARIWDIASAAPLAIRDGHTDNVYAAVFRADGEEIATASWDGIARVWSTAPDFLAATRATKTGTDSVSFAPSGRLLVGHTGNEITWMESFDAAGVDLGRGRWATFDHAGERYATLDGPIATVGVARAGLQPFGTLVGHRDRIGTTSFSPDSQTIATASPDGTVRIWDVTTQRELFVLDHGRVAPTNAAFSPNGLVIATTAMDGALRLWDATDGRLTRTVASPGAAFRVAYSPDGKSIVTAHAGVAIVWDAEGTMLRTLEGHGDVVFAVAFSRDGSLIATCSFDKTIRLWDAIHLELLLVLRGHRGWVNDVAFSPDANYLVTASDDRTIRKWRIERDRRDAVELERFVRCRALHAIDPQRSGLVNAQPTVCDAAD